MRLFLFNSAARLSIAQSSLEIAFAFEDFNSTNT